MFADSWTTWIFSCGESYYLVTKFCFILFYLLILFYLPSLLNAKIRKKNNEKHFTIRSLTNGLFWIRQRFDWTFASLKKKTIVYGPEAVEEMILCADIISEDAARWATMLFKFILWSTKLRKFGSETSGKGTFNLPKSVLEVEIKERSMEKVESLWCLAHFHFSHLCSAPTVSSK